jgi:hypothetical protein
MAAKLIRGDRRHQLKMLENSRELAKDPIAAQALRDNLSLVETKIERLKQELKDDPGEPSLTKDLAIAGGLQSLYQSAYAFLSLTVHSNLRDFERQLAVDADGNLSGLFWGPDPRRLEQTLFGSAEAQIMCCEAVVVLFALPVADVAQLRERYRGLSKSIL